MAADGQIQYRGHQNDGGPRGQQGRDRGHDAEDDRRRQADQREAHGDEDALDERGCGRAEHHRARHLRQVFEQPLAACRLERNQPCQVIQDGAPVPQQEEEQEEHHEEADDRAEDAEREAAACGRGGLQHLLHPSGDPALDLCRAHGKVGARPAQRRADQRIALQPGEEVRVVEKALTAKIADETRDLAGEDHAENGERREHQERGEAGDDARGKQTAAFEAPR